MLEVALSVILILVLTVFAFRVVYPKYKKYRRKHTALDDLEEQYENLRSARKDVVFHYHWAKDRGDWRESDSHEKHCEELDNQLDDIRATFQSIESGDESMFVTRR